MSKKADYVFINCPFDNEYLQMFHALLFTIIYLGKTPLVSETRENRLEQIITLMKKAKYSIHDLSRTENARFNMPFELGVDFGFKNTQEFDDKIILVLEGAKYSLKSIISDIAGNDTMCHNNKPQDLIKCVRDWFFTTIEKIDVAYTEIYEVFYDFLTNFAIGLKNKNIPMPVTHKTIPTSEIINNMIEHINNLKQ